MAVVPFSQRPQESQPEVDQSFVLMAAAQMKAEGLQAESQVQQVSDVKRGFPQSGTETEGAKDVAAIGGAAARGAGRTNKIPELEKHMGDYAQGKISAGELQKVFKSHGWSINLRSKRGIVPAYDPEGNEHELQF